MDSGDKAIYAQAETLQEITATFIENAVQNMNVFATDINFNKLDGDKQAAFAEWHRGMQQAAKVIRRPA